MIYIYLFKGVIIVTIIVEQKLEIDTKALNEDINNFPQVHKITEDMKITHDGVSRLVMLDRYAFKDTEKKTLKVGDFVVLTVKSDPNFPARGLGFIKSINWDKNEAEISVHEDYVSAIDDEDEISTGVVVRSIDAIDKPLEIYYEQIAKRNATGLANVEETEEKRDHWSHVFTEEL